MFHTIITIDIATIGKMPEEYVIAMLEGLDEQLASAHLHGGDIDDWKVRVHQEHNGLSTPVPGWTTPEGMRV